MTFKLLKAACCCCFCFCFCGVARDESIILIAPALDAPDALPITGFFGLVVAVLELAVEPPPFIKPNAEEDGAAGVDETVIPAKSAANEEVDAAVDAAAGVGADDMNPNPEVDDDGAGTDGADGAGGAGGF